MIKDLEKQLKEKDLIVETYRQEPHDATPDVHFRENPSQHTQPTAPLRIKENNPPSSQTHKIQLSSQSS
jgi:hypothetical protein